MIGPPINVNIKTPLLIFGDKIIVLSITLCERNKVGKNSQHWCTFQLCGIRLNLLRNQTKLFKMKSFSSFGPSKYAFYLALTYVGITFLNYLKSISNSRQNPCSFYKEKSLFRKLPNQRYPIICRDNTRIYSKSYVPSCLACKWT